MRCIRTILAVGLRGMACLILLSLVCVENPELPSGEVIGQWLAFDKRVLVAAGCILFAVWVDKKGGEFPDIVSWALIFGEYGSCPGNMSTLWFFRFRTFIICHDRIFL